MGRLSCPGSLCLLLLVTVGCRGSAEPGPADASAGPPSVISGAELARRACAHLTSVGAERADQLVEGAPARAIRCGTPRALPHGSKSSGVSLELAGGEPGNLPVATSLSLVVLIDHSSGAVQRAPSKADLTTAVRHALRGEKKAAEAAIAALSRSKVELPAGVSSWRAALRTVTFDPRLPADEVAGERTWMFIFEPWEEARGGWNFVLLSDPDLRVLRMSGRQF